MAPGERAAARSACVGKINRGPDPPIVGVAGDLFRLDACSMKADEVARKSTSCVGLL